MGTAAMAIEIRLLQSSDSIAELTAVLHSAYVQLQRLGFNYTAVDQSEQRTRERIEGGECYVALEVTRIVGTILFRRHARGCVWYEQPHVAAVHQFGVLPAVQRSGIGSKLMRLGEARAAETGAREIALDTAEGAAHLVNWYQRLGYRRVATAQWQGKTYRSLILSKNLQSSEAASPAVTI
jgi:ribosomal protein S18 acetylase RimI-like enzyme